LKDKNIFKKLIYLESGNKKWHLKNSPNQNSEKWLQHLLPSDAEAPNIENDRKKEPFLIILAVCLLGLVVLSGRLFSLEILSGKANLTEAENNYVHQTPIRAPRGIIYDTKGTELVKNVPNYDLSITPNDLPIDTVERLKILSDIAKVTGSSLDDLKNKITKGGEHSTQPILLLKNIDKDKSIILESQASNLPGMTIEVNPIRQYLDTSLLSHALGYVNRISAEEISKTEGYLLTDYIGKTGLEKSYESTLRGKMGYVRAEVDSIGKTKKDLGTTNPIPGDNIQLSINLELQKHIADALKVQMDKAKVSKATAVAINPQNGQVLALVNIPSYDNNLFANGISEKDYQTLLTDPSTPLLNRAIAGEYPSGSTIKPFVASAALQEGNITENTTVNSTGGIEVGGSKFPDWKPGGHGVVNVVGAIANSVNTFFYAIGGGYGGITGLGPDKIKTYLDKFGFDEYSGIDIGGESKGNIPDPAWKLRIFNEDWYLGDTYHMAIGQGDLLATPLQMANATAAIANGGTLYQPSIVKSITDGSGAVIKTTTPKVVRSNVVSPATIDVVTRGMRETVTTGSGRLLNTLPKEVYAKTGTAQYGPDNSKSHAWFICFTKDAAQPIAMAILVEGAGGGDVFAAPVANDVLKWYFSNNQN